MRTGREDGEKGGGIKTGEGKRKAEGTARVLLALWENIWYNLYEIIWKSI